MARDLKAGDTLELKEKKTGKNRMVTLNKACVLVIQDLLREYDYEDDEPLFRSQRGTLTVPSVNRLVKQWCRAINLRGNYGLEKGNDLYLTGMLCTSFSKS